MNLLTPYCVHGKGPAILVCLHPTTRWGLVRAGRHDPRQTKRPDSDGLMTLGLFSSRSPSVVFTSFPKLCGLAAHCIVSLPSFLLFTFGVQSQAAFLFLFGRVNGVCRLRSTIMHCSFAEEMFRVALPLWTHEEFWTNFQQMAITAALNSFLYVVIYLAHICRI